MYSINVTWMYRVFHGDDFVTVTRQWYAREVEKHFAANGAWRCRHSVQEMMTGSNLEQKIDVENQWIEFEADQKHAAVLANKNLTSKHRPVIQHTGRGHERQRERSRLECASGDQVVSSRCSTR